MGVVIRSISTHHDARGHLTELFRHDELPEGFMPEMGYISVTHPGVSRGPHEHHDQTDLFVFLDGEYELRLWENRPGMAAWRIAIKVGAGNPTLAIVPPGIVHGYKNTGSSSASVLNFPNRLYAGWKRKEEVDEIRHEGIENSPFQMDDE
jgi:dTDP-4-dehydrorhamnose 3,5-epimerase